MKSHFTLSNLLDEQALAGVLRLPVGLIRKWRKTGHGPKFLKFDDSIARYRPEDVASWLASQPNGESQETVILVRQEAQ